MKSILNKEFRYTSSSDTDLRKTFARIRRKLKEESELRERDLEEAKSKTVELRRKA